MSWCPLLPQLAVADVDSIFDCHARLARRGAGTPLDRDPRTP